MRRSLQLPGLAALLFGAVAVSLFASAERATFILTDGSRVSGTVVFHTEERSNFRPDKREFNLGLDTGGERAIQIDQIAVIDFAGGRPDRAELDALKNDTHMLVKRDGSMKTGLLLDFIGGDTVKWKNEGGGEENIPIRDTKRIYMSTPAARTIYNRPGARGAGSSTSSTAPAVLSRPNIPEGPGIAVMANMRWTDASMIVQAGDRLRFMASGVMAYSTGANQLAPPEGDATVRDPKFPVPSLPVGALIGRVATGTPFAIGNNTDPIAMPNRGGLQLSVNDNDLADNSGGFRVVIVRQ